MVVTRDTPQANDIISQTQPLLLANNQDYVDKFAVDHVSYNDSGGGKHNKSTYPIQAAKPTTSSGEGAVYTKTSAVSPGRVDLYYEYQTAGGTDFTGVEFPLNNVKAFGKVDAGGLVAGTAFNVTNAPRSGDVWTVNFTQNVGDPAFPGKIMVLTGQESTSGTPGTVGVEIVSTVQIKLKRSAGDVSGVSFYVIVL